MTDDRNIMYMLGQIDSKLDATNEHLKTLNGKVAAHEKELSTIRIAYAKFGGIVMVVSAGFGLAWTLVGDFIKAKLGLTA
jgi:hypothetical protein